jgi:hypothetical protein
MAITKVTPVQCKLNEFVAETTADDFVALDATLGAEFEMPEKDEKYVIVVKNAASTAVNVSAILKKGNHTQSAFGDVTKVLAQNAIAYAVIDSGRFKNVSGDDKGKVIIKSLDAAGTAGSADLQIKVIRLP